MIEEERQEIDWQYLKSALIFALLALFVAGAVIYYSFDNLDRYDSSFRQQTRKLTNASRGYSVLLKDQALYEAHISEFRALQRKGVIGEERRLEWVEALQRLHKQLKLPAFKFEITPIRKIHTDSMEGGGAISIYASLMELEFGLLHEGELFAFLAGLRAEQVGLFEVRNCRLERVSEQDQLGTERIENMNIQAHCQLIWYSMQPDEEAA